jgi:DNA repair protein RecO (recombination protein O)
MIKSYRVEAIVLRKKNLGEADCLLTVYTKEKGKLTVIAKGVRKIASRKKGSLDTFNKVILQVADTKTIDIVTEALLLDNFSAWKTNITKVSLAYYIAEIIDRLTRDGEPNHEVYGLLVNFFQKLDDNQKLGSSRVEVSKEFLTAVGFADPAQHIQNVDNFIENIIERKLASLRVGKKVLS